MRILKEAPPPGLTYVSEGLAPLGRSIASSGMTATDVRAVSGSCLLTSCNRRAWIRSLPSRRAADDRSELPHASSADLVLVGSLICGSLPEVIRVPLYTAITQDGLVSDEVKAEIAREITRIHTSVMKVPSSFVRVVFLSYPNGSGYTAGERAPTMALNCVLRSGHSAEEKAEMIQQLWAMFQSLTRVATEQLAISLQEVPSSNAMEMGQIMQAVGHQ